MITLLLLTTCREPRELKLPIHPWIISGTRSISMNSLGDDSLLFGAWSGVGRFRGVHRSLFAPGGGFRFQVIQPETLVLTLRLRPRNPCRVSIRLNNRLLKHLHLKTDRETVERIHLLESKINPDWNRISLEVPAQASPLHIQRIQLRPHHIRARSRKRVKGKQTRFSIPARLTYHLWPRRDRFVLRLDRSVRTITSTVYQADIPLSVQSWQKTDRFELDLSPWENDFIRLSVDLDGVSRPIRILRSELRTPPAPGQPAIHAFQNRFFRRKNLNILVILLDSARADRFISYGYHRPTTPNISELADHSLVFTRAFSEAAYTLASTGTLFSGMAPDKHNATSDYFGGLNHNIKTLAEAFKEHGYYTGAVSGIPYCSAGFNMDQGFAAFIPIYSENRQAMAGDVPDHFRRLVRRSRQEDRPFFIYLHLREPHIDFRMPPPYFGTFHRGYTDYPSQAFLKRLENIYFSRGPYRHRPPDKEDIALLRDAYDENLLSADAVIPRLTAILEEGGMREQTMIILLSDHGEGLYEHGEIGHNRVLYREGMHIPLMIHLPGESRGLTSDLSVQTSDLTHTLLRYLNDGTTAGYRLRGIFHRHPRKLLIGRSIFHSRFYPHYVLQCGDYRCIIRFPAWRKNRIELYDTNRDPGETNPLSDSDIRQFFLFQLTNFFRQLEDQPVGHERSQLDEETRKSLESLGYMQ